MGANREPETKLRALHQSTASDSQLRLERLQESSRRESLASKRLGTQLAASRREALELRTHLERAERQSNWNISTSVSPGGGIQTVDGNPGDGFVSEKLIPKTPPSSCSALEFSAEIAVAEARQAADSLRLELARAQRRIHELNEENDELRRFAKSVVGVDVGGNRVGNANGSGHGETDGNDSIRSPANPPDTSTETKRLLKIVNASPAGLKMHDLLDGLGSGMIDDGGDASDDENKKPPNQSQSPHVVNALRLELRTQAEARAILEEEVDGYRDALTRVTTDLKDSKQREEVLTKSLQIAQRDAMRAAQMGEEIVRSSTERCLLAETNARSWQDEAQRLRVMERENAENRLVAAAGKAQAAAVRERNSIFDDVALDKRDGVKVGSTGTEQKQKAWRAPSPPPPSLPVVTKRSTKWDLTFEPPRSEPPVPRNEPTFRPAIRQPNKTPTSIASDSPFAVSDIFADGTPGSATPTSRAHQEPHWLHKRTPVSSQRSYEQTVAPTSIASMRSPAKNETTSPSPDTHVPSTPGELLAASLRRQTKTLDDLRNARARRDAELKRVRNRLDQLVASPRRVGLIVSYTSPKKLGVSSYEARSAHSAVPNETHLDAEHTVEAAELTREEERAKAAYELARDKRMSVLSRGRREGGDESESVSLSSTDPSSTQKAPSLGRSDKNIEPAKQSSSPRLGRKMPVMPKMPAMSMPKFSLGMDKAAKTIQSAWRRRKKSK